MRTPALPPELREEPGGIKTTSTSLPGRQYLVFMVLPSRQSSLRQHLTPGALPPRLLIVLASSQSNQWYILPPQPLSREEQEISLQHFERRALRDVALDPSWYGVFVNEAR